MSTKALAALGLAGALAADASVASAQTGGRGNQPSSPKAQPAPTQPSEDRTAPKPPAATAPAKIGEARPGPLDVVVQFQGNSAEIDAGANAALDQTADWLKQDPTRSITIEVHPNDLARADLDGAITDERADATRRYLVAQGVAETQIRVMTTSSASATVTPTDRNRRTVFIMTLGAGVAVAGAPAPEPVVAAPVEPAPLVEPVAIPVTEPETAHLLTPFGMAVTVGGGAMGFLDGEARDLAGVGGAWEARLTVGTRSPLAFEAAYVGSAQDVDALGLDNSAVLLGSTVEGDLRLNFTTTTFVQPYIFGGIGYTHFDIINENFNTSSVNDSESMGSIPVGAGLGFQWRGLLFDMRGTLRPAFNDDLVAEPGIEDDPLNENDTQTDLDTWTAAARVGWEF
jgi:outer membrane protein OmpA-like peptidoglycan-associated protein